MYFASIIIIITFMILGFPSCIKRSYSLLCDESRARYGHESYGIGIGMSQSMFTF